MKKFECPFNQTSEYDGKCKNCSFQLMCDNFPKLYGNVGSTNQTYSYPHSNDSNIPYADCCASRAYSYTGPIVDNGTNIYMEPQQYYYHISCEDDQIKCDKKFKDPDDWFLKKTLKENKIKKFFKKVFRGYYIFK